MTDIDPSRFRLLVELREKRDVAKREAENTERDYREYEAELFEELQDAGYKSLKLDLDGYGEVRFQPRETVYGRILDLDAALDAFENEGRADELTKAGIEKRRLNELVRERLEAGLPLPNGVDTYSNRGITISRKA